MAKIDFYGETIERAISKSRKIKYNNCTFQLHPEINTVLRCLKHPYQEDFEVFQGVFRNPRYMPKSTYIETIALLRRTLAKNMETLQLYMPEQAHEMKVHIDFLEWKYVTNNNNED